MPHKDKIQRRAYHKQYSRARYLADPGYKRTIHLKRKYGMSAEEFARLSQAQGNACAICRNVFTLHKSGRIGQEVDHDHNTGKLRGLLCHRCNVMIGWAKENVLVLESAAQYIRRYQEVKSNG